MAPLLINSVAIMHRLFIAAQCNKEQPMNIFKINFSDSSISKESLEKTISDNNNSINLQQKIPHVKKNRVQSSIENDLLSLESHMLSIVLVYKLKIDEIKL